MRTKTQVSYRLLYEVRTYEDAQFLVDALADARFPVQSLRIVGTGVETVEQIRGRRTVLSATMEGIARGLWLGLFIGILVMMFTGMPRNPWVLIGAALGVGAAWGGLGGMVAQLMSRGRRDFSSIKSMRATAYEVQVLPEFLSQALSTLREAGVHLDTARTGESPELARAQARAAERAAERATEA